MSCSSCAGRGVCSGDFTSKSDDSGYNNEPHVSCLAGVYLLESMFDKPIPHPEINLLKVAGSINPTDTGVFRLGTVLPEDWDIHPISRVAITLIPPDPTLSVHGPPIRFAIIRTGPCITIPAFRDGR